LFTKTNFLSAVRTCTARNPHGELEMIETSKVSRSLDRKTLILWLEITDIFALVLLCSLLNLVFGGTALKIYLVYMPTLILGTTLIMTKRGKPEGFLLHFLKFHLQPKQLSCFPVGPEQFPLSNALQRRREGSNR
jgi:hypothetical protein